MKESIINNSAEISIIVPVYKAEQWIHRCIDSLRRQTFSDIEIILVDDGSPDSCGRICDEYAAVDNRIKVIHKQNEGVAVARQAGTDLARGEYIIHADPDDWVEPDMLEQLYAKAKGTGADVTICDYYENKNNEQIYVIQNPGSIKPHDVMCELFHRLHGSLWNKLAKRACYIKYNLQFTPGINYCEDVLIWVQLLQHPEVKVAYLNKAFYHYNQDNVDSLVHRLSSDMMKTRLKYLDKLEIILPKADKYIARNKKVKFYLVLWRLKFYNDRDILSKHIKNKTILQLDLPFSSKIKYLLINNRLGCVCKIIDSIKMVLK